MDVAIVGTGIDIFGRNPRPTLDMAATAVRTALSDAGAEWSDVQYAAGGSHSGGHADSIVAHLGLTGLPFTNVFNGCATGASALSSAVAAVESGKADLALALGFDRHARGAFAPDPKERGLPQWYGDAGMMVTTQFFGMRIRRYLDDHDLGAHLLPRVAAKAFRNARENEFAWRREPIAEELIESSLMVADPLTKFMFCSPGDGAAAVLVCPASEAHRYRRPPLYVRACVQRTRRFGSFEVFSPSFTPVEGVSVTGDASAAAFERAGLGPTDVDVAQVQDTDSGAEIIHLAETGLCAHGEQEKLIREGETEIGGRLPTNTDGGCIANGEPIGASALRQVHESVLQLRGDAGGRQVPGNPSTAFTHVYGAPGISACTVLTR